MSIEDTSRTMPPLTGTEPPKGDDPDPLGMIGILRDDANLTTAETASSVLAWTTASGVEEKRRPLRKPGISDWSLE